MIEPTNASEQQASEPTSETAAEQTATDETTKASEAQPADPTPEPEADAKSDAAQPESAVLQVVSVAELIARAEARRSDITEAIATAQSHLMELAEQAARGGATADAMQAINDCEDGIKALHAERAEMDETLIPLRAAVAKVDAERAAAAAESERTELAHGIAGLIDEVVAAAQEMEGAVNNLVAIAKHRRELRKRFREVISAVVPNPQPRGMINNVADGLFTETPTLDQFLTVDAQLLAGSGVHAAERAQKVRDRIAEATA